MALSQPSAPQNHGHAIATPLRDRRNTARSSPLPLFHTFRSLLLEPRHCICITSCRLCISFAFRSEATQADVLKMIFPAGALRVEKPCHKLCFCVWSCSISRRPACNTPPAGRWACRRQETLHDAPPQALFRQTPHGHSPAVSMSAFSEMTLFHFGAFR